jgi:hypothetical protein
MASCDVYRCASYFISAVFSNSENFILCLEQWLVIKCLIHVVLWTRLRVSFNACIDPLFDVQSDLPGVNPATNDRMILYYCLTTKVDLS